MKALKKKWAMLLFIVILIIQISVILYWGSEKSGFHHDEILSFQLSNLFAERRGFHIANLNDCFSEWHDSEYFSRVLAAQEGGLFDFSEVYRNLEYDIHPLLFNSFLHLICSFFPGVFSKWLGIVPNILYFVFTQIALYAIGKRLEKKEFGLLLVAAYGFSAAAISNVIFIRMYAMMTMWAVMQLYCHLRIYENPKQKRWYVFAGVFTFLGMNTQYYFIILQFFVSACCFIWMIKKRIWMNAVSYAASIFAGLALTVLLWPPIITDIFHSNRGVEATANLLSGSNRLSDFLSGIDDLLANGWGIPILLALGVLMILACVRKKEKGVIREACKMPSVTALITVCGYVLIVSRIAPYSDPRYVMAVLPFLAMSILGLFWAALMKLMKNPKLIMLCMAAVIAVVSIGSCAEKRVNYLYPSWSVEIKALEPYRDLDAVIVVDNAWKASGTMVLHMSEHPQSLLIKSKEIEELETKASECEKGFVLYLEKSASQEEQLEMIEERTNTTSELLFSKNGSFGIYRCILNE